MRKMLAIATLGVFVSSGVALAGDPDVGCGWGTQAFNGKVGVAPKVMAATTNGFHGSQTFGISSGTAGCSQGGMVKAEAQLRMYAGANIDTLASDMAAGKPKPDLFLHAAARVGIDPTDCIVVEDSPAGVSAAVAAGMAAIGYVGGSHAPANLCSELSKAGASAVIHDMRALKGTVVALRGY